VLPEGITYQVYDLVKSMEADLAKKGELRVDGGGGCQQFNDAVSTDLFGFNVIRPKMLETTALGAAYLRTSCRILGKYRRTTRAMVH
jgi:glycerol kinase